MIYSQILTVCVWVYLLSLVTDVLSLVSVPRGPTGSVYSRTLPAGGEEAVKVAERKGRREDETEG